MQQCQALSKFIQPTLLQFTKLYMYLAIDCGGYMCMNSLCALIVVWLDASQRSQGGVELNKSAREMQNNFIVSIGYSAI